MLNKVHVNDHKLTQTRRTRHSESSVKWTDWDKFDNPKIIKINTHYFPVFVLRMLK